MIISERVFQMLKEKGMSQKEFSDRTGISQSTISDWKRKQTNPASDKILLICDVLEMTPYELLSGVENENYRPLDYVIVDKKSEDYIFLKNLRELNEKDRYRIMGYLDSLLEEEKGQKKGQEQD